MTDKRDLAHTQAGGAVATTPTTQAAQLLAMIVEASKDPSVDAAKVETMARLATDLQDREQKAEFNRDKAAALIEMPRITKRGEITIPAKDGRPARVQGRYAKFEDIDRVTRPILASHNLTVWFEVGHDGPMITVRPVLGHRNGFTETGEAVKLPADTSGSKNNTQAVGSAASYGKRIAIKAILNIIEEGEDDDGNMGLLESDPVTDVQARWLGLAEAAAQKGEYAEFWGTLDAKGRAWLIRAGHHKRLGGADMALPGPTPSPAPKPSPSPAPAPAPSPAPAPAASQERKRRTPEEQVKAYRAAIMDRQAIPTRDALLAYQQQPAIESWLQDMANGPLADQVLDANSEALDSFSAPENDDPANDLFGRE